MGQRRRFKFVIVYYVVQMHLGVLRNLCDRKVLRLPFCVMVLGDCPTGSLPSDALSTVALDLFDA